MSLKMIKNHHIKIVSLIMALVFVFSCVSVTAFALTDSEKKKYEEKIESIKGEISDNKKKIDALKEKISSYDDDIASLQEKIDALQEQIDLYNQEIAIIDEDISKVDAQITNIENEITDLNTQIDKLEEDIIDLEQQIADTLVILGKRLRANYMSGAGSSLEFLLSEDDFEYTSYLERKELMERISEHDDKIITDLSSEKELKNEKKTAVEDTKTLLDTKVSELDLVKKEYEAKKKEEVSARKKIEAAEAEIKKDLDSVMEIISSLNKESDAYQEAIERGEDSISEYERKLSEQNVDFGSGTTGYMIWPLPYGDSYVSSSYKMRTLNGRTSFHYGIDISRYGGAMGSKIVAVKDGTVERAISSGYNGGCGKHVIINHGEGVKTYHYHMSAIYVHSGDYVTQGTVIGLVGNTGYSFGAHLHFGIMINGSWVNPINYLSLPGGLRING